MKLWKILIPYPIWLANYSLPLSIITITTTNTVKNVVVVMNMDITNTIMNTVKSVVVDTSTDTMNTIMNTGKNAVAVTNMSMNTITITNTAKNVVAVTNMSMNTITIMKTVKNVLADITMDIMRTKYSLLGAKKRQLSIPKVRFWIFLTLLKSKVTFYAQKVS